MSQLTVQRTAGSIHIRLPRQSSQRSGGFVGAGIGLGMAAFASIFLYAGARPLWRDAGHAGSMMVFTILFAIAFTAVPGVIFLIGLVAIVGGFIAAFGQTVITVNRRQIRTAVMLIGPLQFWINRLIDDVDDLELKPGADAQASLAVRFHHGKPLVLARAIDSQLARELSTEVRSALSDVADVRRVSVHTGDSPATGSLTSAAVPTGGSPPVPSSTAIIRSQPRAGAVRFVIAPRTWLAFIPTGFFLAIAISFVGGMVSPSLRGHWATKEFAFAGGVIAVVLLAMLLFLRSHKRYTIEADRDGLSLDSRSPLSANSRRWRSSEIDHLEVEISQTRNDSNQPTTRWLTLVQTGGTRTRLFSRSHEELRWMEHALAVALGPASSAALADAAGKSEPALRTQSSPAWFGFLFAGFAAIFVVVISLGIVQQDQRLKLGTPTQATIISSSTKTTRSSEHNDTIEASIRYTYVVDGHKMTATEIFPSNITGPWERSAGLALGARVRHGSVVPAWYVPGNPPRSYLIATRSSSGHEGLMLIDLFILAGLGIACWPVRKTIDGTPTLPGMRSYVPAIAFIILGLASLADFQLGGPAQWSTEMITVSSVWAALAIVSVIASNAAYRRSAAVAYDSAA